MASVTADDDLTPRHRRLLFRALHRGTKECDLMLGGFVRRHLAALSPPELDELEAILEMPDVDLTDWLSGRRPIPEEAQGPLLARIVAEMARPGAGRAP
ncbi:succinate dehydrogenase assembly factor 2 [Roseococcus sp. MDT2-1-1]|uniref:FAD assembly factor SdhE n=1 Tax=Sabulicella glaciei TaxID=2984948 RepID=A0ABT3NPJ4_9PROT|nr:succinate dehydrogenase assembly factor 2 [Roseococcus sp. MDT2-1-1]MCW8084070.1 succinate dehydrogenase assembly factor 2 [Roseococcus sp. MDT2-1-1]